MGKYFERLNLRQQRFVLEYLADGNAKRAVIEAGYNGTAGSLQVMGAKLLTQRNIQLAIKEIGQPIFRERKITVEEIAKQLSYYVYRDIGELLDDDYCLKVPLSKVPPHVRQCIEELTVDHEYDRETGEITKQKVKVKLVSKIRALELAMKYLNMLEPDTTININNTQINWNQFYGVEVDKDVVEKKMLALEGEVVNE